MAKKQEPSDYFLAHPVYLNVPMMLSFLAYIQGGVSMEHEETRKEGQSAERNTKASGRIKLPSLAGIFGGEVGLEGGGIWKKDGTLELKAARHHTEASLFNALYAYLHDDGKVVILKKLSQLDTLRPSQIVEVAGVYAGNPLEELLSTFLQLVPYIESEEDASKKENAPRKARKSGNPATRTQGIEIELQRRLEAATKEQTEAIRIMRRLHEDISKAPVHDVLLQVGEEFQAILTVSSEFYSSATSEYLRSGEFRVLGKVTQVLKEPQTVNLARRTVLGLAGSELVNDMITQIRREGGLVLDVADPIVKAPAVQILPMAIFV